MNTRRNYYFRNPYIQCKWVLFLTICVIGNVNAETNIKPLQHFLTSPADDFEIQYRITSKSAGTTPFVANINLRGADENGHREYLIEINQSDTKQQYCFACEANYVMQMCKSNDLLMPDVKQGAVPGTLLPWGELINGLCMDWTVKQSAMTDVNKDNGIAEIRPKKRLPRIHWDYTRAYLDDNGLPAKLERILASGKILRQIRILEIRKLFSMTGVRKVLVEYGSTRVLLEALSMQLIDSDDSNP